MSGSQARGQPYILIILSILFLAVFGLEPYILIILSILFIGVVLRRGPSARQREL